MFYDGGKKCATKYKPKKSVLKLISNKYSYQCTYDWARLQYYNNAKITELCNTAQRTALII